MERNLLLGNGINAHLGVIGMGVAEIAERFTNALIQYNDFFDLMFGVRFTKELCNALYAKVNDLGIESLASVIYEYIMNISGIYYASLLPKGRSLSLHRCTVSQICSSD